MVSVTSDGGVPVNPAVAKEILGAVRDLVGHGAFQALLEHAPGMSVSTAKAAIGAVQQGIYKVELDLAASAAGNSRRSHGSHRMMAGLDAPAAPSPPPHLKTEAQNEPPKQRAVPVMRA